MRASYPTYKSTAIPWPESIPESWELVKISSVFRERKETVSDKDFAPLSVTMQGIVPQLETAAKTDNGDNRKKVCAGDFVINSRSDRKGSAGISPMDGSVSVISIVLRPSKKLHAKYVDYLLTNYYFQEEFYRYGKGIVADLWSTKYSSMKGMFIPLPSIEEQTAIANYLDAKTEQINRFIAKKEKLIALLKEKKQAVINELLSKNTDNWPLVKLKYILSEVNDRSETGKEELLSLSKYQGVIPKSKLEERAGGADSLIGYKKVYYDTIVVNKMQASNGIIGVSKVEGITSPDYSIYKVKSKEYSPDFIGYMLVQPNMLAEYKRLSTGVMDGYIRLYTDDLFDIKIAIPGKSQQLDVLNKIEQATTQINLTINQVEREVGKVKELKQSLIAEVVTGKIKVV